MPHSREDNCRKQPRRLIDQANILYEARDTKKKSSSVSSFSSFFKFYIGETIVYRDGAVTSEVKRLINFQNRPIDLHAKPIRSRLLFPVWLDT